MGQDFTFTYDGKTIEVKTSSFTEVDIIIAGSVTKTVKTPLHLDINNMAVCIGMQWCV